MLRFLASWMVCTVESPSAGLRNCVSEVVCLAMSLEVRLYFGSCKLDGFDPSSLGLRRTLG